MILNILLMIRFARVFGGNAAPKSTYANVFVDGVLIGLYTCVQSIDEDFTNEHFYERNGPFFKAVVLLLVQFENFQNEFSKAAATRFGSRFYFIVKSLIFILYLLYINFFLNN